MKGTDIINTVMLIKERNYNLSFMIDKSYFSEYISNDSSPSEETCVKEEPLKVTQDDETVVIKYLLDIMKVHGIITEEEYQAVLYKYS